MRLGLLSAARIAPKAVVEPAGEVPGVEVAAVAARAPAVAEEFAERWGIPRVEASYDDLIAAGDLDAIYVATPAALHRRWTVAALEAGLHVLCEKPLGSNADDARAMVGAAERTGGVLVEAYHWRYHPLVDRISDVVASGRLGALRRVEGSFTIPRGAIPPRDIRWQLGLGGGALMDLGCYPLQWCRFVCDAEPTVLSAVATEEADSPGVDGSMTAKLDFEGVEGVVACSMVDDGDGRGVELTVTGTDGEMVVTNPLAPQMGNEVLVRTADGENRESAPLSSTYVHQLEAFRDAVVDGTPVPTGGGDSIATMEAIDAIYRASGLGVRPSL